MHLRGLQQPVPRMEAAAQWQSKHIKVSLSDWNGAIKAVEGLKGLTFIRSGRCHCHCKKYQPHVVFFLLSNLGFNDFADSTDMAHAWLASDSR